MIFFTVLILFFYINIFLQITQNIKGIVIDKQPEFILSDTSVTVKQNWETYGVITVFDGKNLTLKTFKK